MGFLFATSGDAHVFGVNAGSLAARRRTGFLPEVAVYYPFLTARETLALYATLLEIPRSEQEKTIAQLIERVGLSGRDREPLRAFSRGMLQRIGIAQAIMGDPDLLILDEVTSGLDPVARRDLRQILLEFKSRGKTVFFSSHELSEVTLVCDRVVLIDEGKVLQERPLRELLESMRRLVVTVAGATVPETLPEDVTLRNAGDDRLTFVAETQFAQTQLLQQLESVGAHILEMFQETGSLEDYFVKVVGHKVT
jgi:ABC-2 type transport system ATP-binding protein